jgi:hypothetical protein
MQPRIKGKGPDWTPGTARDSAGGYFRSQLATLGLAALSVLTLLIWSPRFTDPDAFYHVRISLEMRKNGIISEFPQMPFTVLADHFTDHHILYHALLALSLWTDDPWVSFVIAKALTVTINTALFISIFLVLRKLGFRFALLAPALLLLFTSWFLFRLQLPKATGLALILLVWELYFLFSGRYLRLGWLALVHVFTHGSFPLLVVVVGVNYLVCVAFDIAAGCASVENSHRLGSLALRSAFRKEHWIAPGSTFAGIGIGLALSPSFPHNLHFYYYQVFEVVVVNYGALINVGNEWYAPYLGPFLSDNLLHVGLGAAALVVFAWKIRRQTRVTWTLLLLSMFLFYAVTRAKRNVEYFFPVYTMWLTAVLSVAASAPRGEWLSELSAIKRFLLQEVGAESGPSAPLSRAYLYLKKWWLLRWRRASGSRRLRITSGFAVLAAVSGLLVGYAYNDIRTTKGLLDSGKPYDHLMKESEYLRRHGEPGEIIWHSEWDTMPALYRWNPDRRFIVGLDPTFLYRKDPDVYWEWADLSYGRAPAVTRAHDIIVDTFHARWVLAARFRKKLIEALDADGRFKLVFKGADSLLYRVDR